MDAEVKKAKVKAKLRNEVCGNCSLGKSFVDLQSGKVLVRCSKHKHNKKPHEWCRFYASNPSYERLKPRMFG